MHLPGESECLSSTLGDGVELFTFVASGSRMLFALYGGGNKCHGRTVKVDTP